MGDVTGPAPASLGRPGQGSGREGRREPGGGSGRRRERRESPPPAPGSALPRFPRGAGALSASAPVSPPLPRALSRAGGGKAAFARPAPARPPLAVGAGCCARSLPAPHCLNGDVSVSILNAFAGTLEKFFPAGMRGFSLRSSKVYNPCQRSQTYRIQPRSFPLLSAARFPHCRIPNYIDNLAHFNKISPQIRSGSLFHM